MPNESQIDRIEQMYGDLARIGGRLERTAILTNVTVIDATPAGLTGRVIIQDPRDGDYIPALTVPGVVYNNNDLVNVLFLEGTEPLAYQQGSGSSGSNAFWTRSGTEISQYNDADTVALYDDTPTNRIDLDPGTMATDAIVTIVDQTGALQLELNSSSSYRILFSDGSTDVDIVAYQVDVTGTPTYQWDESEDSFSQNKGLIVTSGNVLIPDDLVHHGDADTLLSFTDDDIEFQAGGITLLQLTEAVQDVVDIGDVGGGGDVDIDFNNGQMFLQGSNGFLGLGITPATPLDIDTGSNSTGLRLRGLAETVEIADFFVGAAGQLIISLTAGSDTGQFFDLRAEDNEFGIIIRESDGTGTAAYANLYVVDDTVNRLNIVISAAASTLGLVIDANPRVFINDTTNTFQTIGLTINQDANDDEIVSLKSSDVAHGMTSLTETDTFFALAKGGAALGGGLWDGYTEGNFAVHFRGNVTSDDTTKSTAALGAVILTARKKSGTSAGAMGADANLFVVRDNTNARFLVDAEGDVHYDGTTNAGSWDAEDDTELLRTLTLETADPSTVVKTEFDEFIRYNRDSLIRLGILSEGGFINATQVQRVVVGALWQQHIKIQELEGKLNGIN